MKWKVLSEVGQTYGGISAALSGIALCGIVASLILQRRQYRLSEYQGLRQRHQDLMRMTFEDPELKPCWGETSSGSGLAEKEAAYCNLILDHWQLLWRLEIVTANELERIAATFFQGIIGRAYWQAYGKGWTTSTDQRTVHFLVIFDHVFAQAVESGPPTVGRITEQSAVTEVHDCSRADAAKESAAGVRVVTTAAIAGAAVALAIDRSFREQRRRGAKASQD
jgi:hypothetical protein